MHRDLYNKLITLIMMKGISMNQGRTAPEVPGVPTLVTLEHLHTRDQYQLKCIMTTAASSAEVVRASTCTYADAQHDAGRTPGIDTTKLLHKA